MTDNEKIEKIYAFAKSQEDFFCKPIEDGKYEPGSLAAFNTMAQAAAYQKIRYFIENIMES